MKTTPMRQDSFPMALGEEFISHAVADQIAQIVAIHREVQENVDRKLEPVPCGQNPKQLGCFRAEFVVEPNLISTYGGDSDGAALAIRMAVDRVQSLGGLKR